MKTLIRKITPYWRTVVSPTLVATLILLMTIRIFGLENSMIAPFATISYLRVINLKNHYEGMIKHFIRYGITAILAYAAGLSLVFCIVINAAALFILAFYVLDEYHPENHLPVGMALIFFQIAQIHSTAALGKRIGAIALSFVIIFAFVLVITLRDRKQDRFLHIIEQGFSYAEALIPVCRQGEEEQIKKLHLDLREVNRNLSEEIYAYNRATFKKKGAISFYCRFVILFQVINYLTKYYQEPGNLERAEDMLNDYKALFRTVQPEPDYFMLRLRSDRLNIKDFQFRYAMRLVIAMTPCMVFAYLTDIPNAYWLAFSLFYMITPSSDDTMKTVYKRVGGTFAGILISLVLFALFPNLTARIIITAVLNLFIYATKNHIFSVAYITCATLAMQTYDLGNLGSMMRCFLFTLIGAVIALLVNRFLFQVHTKVQMKLITDYLQKIRETLRQVSAPGKLNRKVAKQLQKEYMLTADWQENELQKRHLTDQLCIRSYLLTRRLQELDETQPEEKRRAEAYFTMEKAHMNEMAVLLMDFLARPGENPSM